MSAGSRCACCDREVQAAEADVIEAGLRCSSCTLAGAPPRWRWADPGQEGKPEIVERWLKAGRLRGLCPCGAAEAWLLAPMIGPAERPTPVEVWRPGPDKSTELGQYAALLCRRCGRSQWWAEDYLPAHRSPSPAPPCGGCGSAVAFAIDRVEEYVIRYGGEGHMDDHSHSHLTGIPVAAPMRILLNRRLSWLQRLFGNNLRWATLGARICAGCGAVRWNGRASQSGGAGSGLESEGDRRCGGCDGGVARLALSERGRSLHRGRGGLEVELCVDCGAATLWGVRLDELEESSGAGLWRVVRTAVGTPFR